MRDFEKYMELKKRAEKTGHPEEVQGLSQLLFMIQFMNAEEASWRKHKKDMKEWKNNIIKSVEDSLRRLEEAEMNGSMDEVRRWED